MSRDSEPRGPAEGPSGEPEKPTGIASSRISAFLKELARPPSADLRDLFAGFKAGARVGKFELVRELGRGGFGVVYEASDTVLGRQVAFKAMRPGRPGGVAMGEAWLLREAVAAARLSHPNLVTLHEFGTCHEGPYLVMELLQGETLQGRLSRGPMPVREAVRVAVEMARALCHAHAQGVLHRDVKPSNVFLTGGGAVKVLDFGLATMLGGGGLGAAGTPAYMAPEQWRGEPEDARTDLFSAAVVLFQSLTGELPFAVTRERSAALDPGPTPTPLRPGVPRRLAELVSSGLARDPARRPRNAQVWLDGLLAAERELASRSDRRRRWLMPAALAVVALALAALVSIPRVWPPQPPPRLTVVIADTDNYTPEGDLGSLHGMLTTSLEQSHRLDVLSRVRVFDLLRRQGHDRAEKVDEKLAREAGHLAGAQALLVSTVRRFDESYVLELQGINLANDRFLFTVREEGRGRKSIPGMVDRISEKARAGFQEKAADVEAARVKVEEALTPSLEAYQHFFRGVECENRPSLDWKGERPQVCAEELKKAVAIDPTFTLAWYQLALVGREMPSRQREVREAIAQALRGVDRVGTKDQMLIRALAAHLGGKDDEALSLYRNLLADHPTDKVVLYLAGDLLQHRGDVEGAVPYFERALALDPWLALDPSLEWPLEHLPDDLGRLGRTAQLETLVGSWSAAPPSAPVYRALATSYLWLGRNGPALAAAEKAVATGGGAAARRDLAVARFHAGKLSEAEELLRQLSPRGASPELATLAAVQGRRREALRLVVENDDPDWAPYYRAAILVGDGEPAAVLGEARRLRDRVPAFAPNLAVALAYCGDLEHAAELGAGLEPGSPIEVIHRAVVAWKRGDFAQAKAGLRAVDARIRLPANTLPPSFLLGEVCAAAGDDAEAVAALRSYQALPYFGIWQGWARPRSLYLMARSHERLGQRGQALTRVDELLALWKGADADQPLLEEAKALRRRLTAAPPRPPPPTRP